SRVTRWRNDSGVSPGLFSSATSPGRTSTGNPSWANSSRRRGDAEPSSIGRSLLMWTKLMAAPYHFSRLLTVFALLCAVGHATARGCDGRSTAGVDIEELWVPLGGGRFQSLEAPGDETARPGAVRGVVLTGFLYRPLVFDVPTPGGLTPLRTGVGSHLSTQVGASAALTHGLRAGAVLPFGVSFGGNGLSALNAPYASAGPSGGIGDPRLHLSWQRHLDNLSLLVTEQVSLPIGQTS